MTHPIRQFINALFGFCKELFRLRTLLCCQCLKPFEGFVLFGFTRARARNRRGKWLFFSRGRQVFEPVGNWLGLGKRCIGWLSQVTQPIFASSLQPVREISRGEFLGFHRFIALRRAQASQPIDIFLRSSNASRQRSSIRDCLC